MIESLLFGNRSLDEMKAALDASSLRQRVVASNIANANTPGFQPQQVRFEELLENAREDSQPARTHPEHMVGPEGSSVAPTPRVAARGTGTVELEQEMVELQQNAIHYRALSQFVAKRYRGLMDAIGTQG
jgi:flagellar basal-body rod protein FlgB